MTIIVCELEINNFTTCDQWDIFFVLYFLVLKTFKKGYSFFIWDSARCLGKWMACSFSRGCEREKLFLLHLFYLPLLQNNKQKCFMDAKALQNWMQLLLKDVFFIQLFFPLRMQTIWWSYFKMKLEIYLEKSLFSMLQNEKLRWFERNKNFATEFPKNYLWKHIKVFFSLKSHNLI